MARRSWSWPVCTRVEIHDAGAPEDDPCSMSRGPASRRQTREQILDLYRAWQTKLGAAPGRARFYRLTGIKPADVAYYWPRFTELTADAGALPNRPQEAMTDDEIFGEYARVCLHLRKIPTRDESRIAQRQLGTRTHTVFSRFGSIYEFDKKFRAWLQDQSPGLRSILELPGWERKTWRSRTTKPSGPTVVHPSIHPFLPASLQYLDALALGEVPPNEPQDANISLTFERRCADAFRALGFEVRQLGQGKGRNADCLAIARRDGFAVVIDAKTRHGRYVLGTDDRAFLEYAGSHSRALTAEGIERAYFVVIASAFEERDRKQLADTLTGSPIRGFALMTARALIRIVEESIRDRYRFSLSDLEKLLFGNPILAN